MGALIKKAYALAKKPNLLDQTAATVLFRDAALSGHTDAQYQYALRRLMGRGCEVEVSDAIFYAQTAAQKNHPGGHYLMGLFYNEGLLASETPQYTAFEHFDKAAQAGHAESQFILAVYFLEIPLYGVYNPRKALKLLQKAARQGHDEAITVLQACYKEGIGCLPWRILKPIYFFKRVRLAFTRFLEPLTINFDDLSDKQKERFSSYLLRALDFKDLKNIKPA